MGTKNYSNEAKIDELTTERKMAYSINEAAELLSVCTGHLRNEHKRGKISFVRSGRRILVLDSELKKYLQEQVVEQV